MLIALQAIFFSAATAAGAFGGLLARGIMEMDGVGGKAGWSWIFILGKSTKGSIDFRLLEIFLDMDESKLTLI